MNFDDVKQCALDTKREALKMKKSPEKIEEMLSAIGGLKVAVEDERTDAEKEAERIQKIHEKAKNYDKQLITVLLKNATTQYENDKNVGGILVGQSNHGTLPMDIVPSFVKNLAIKHLVGVQPMMQPVGQMYLLKYIDRGEDMNPEINDRKATLNVESQIVEAKNFKFNTSHMMEAMMEISSGLESSFNIANEITNEIYEDIKHDIAKIAHKDSVDVSDNHTANDIFAIISQYANEIGRNTRRGTGNWAIVSSTLAEIIAPKLKIDETLSDRNYGYMGYIGNISGVAVYHDNTIKHNKILMGYRGNNGDLDVGYIYCPYIPVVSSGVIINPETFQPSINLMSRSGKIVNRNSETVEYEIDDSNRTESKTTYDACNYFYNITLDGLPAEKDLLKLKARGALVTDLPKEKGDDKLSAAVFDMAMKMFD